MKKCIALLLCAVLSLSLAACSLTQEQKYPELTLQLDAGNLAGVKRELSALIPEFAAEQEKLQTYEKYSALIDALEQGDLDTAANCYCDQAAAIQNTRYTYVDIDESNWQEYFELNFAPCWTENYFGEPESVWFAVMLTIKPAYRDRVMRSLYPSLSADYSPAHTGDGQIVVECAWHYADTYVTLDYETRSCIWGETQPYGDYGEQLQQTAAYFFDENNGNSSVLFYIGEPTFNYEDLLVAPRVTDLELLRIKGRFPLLAS